MSSSLLCRVKRSRPREGKWFAQGHTPCEAKDRRGLGLEAARSPAYSPKGFVLLCVLCCLLGAVQRWWSWPEGDLSGSAGRQILPSTDVSDRPTLTQWVKQRVSSNRLGIKRPEVWAGLRGTVQAVSPRTSLRFKFTVGKTHCLFP